MADLNPTQSQAVRHLNGPSLVIAGAGSGKTRVITAKLGHLIDAGYSGRAIAAITFTNKAAAEMAERFAQQRKLKPADRPTISTFHSLGMKMLRTSGRAIGLKPSFSIFDADDCGGLLAQLLATTDRKLIKLAQAKISLWKNALTEPEAALQAARGESEIRIARAFVDYQATLEGYQAVDFDDLIRLPLKLLRNDTEARRYWHERLRYFLVDEYQDTNAAQYALLRELVGDRNGLTAVGDDDQSIYGWRGATLENLKRLGQDFPNLTVIKLEQNYRSTRNILDAANTLIARNPKLYTKTLWSALGSGDPLKVMVCDDDEDEAERVVMRIQAARFEKKLDWSDFAILYRGNHQARVIEQMLRKERIPYQISGGQSFFDRAEIKDLCAYLRLLANDEDDPAFIRAATTPRRGIGPQTLSLLGEYAGERDISLFQALFETGVENKIPERQLHPLRAFGDFIDRLRHRAEREPTSEMLDTLITAIDYEAYLMEQGDERSATTRWQYVCEFRDWISRRGDEDGKTLIDMAQYISLVTRLEGRDEETDGVKLSTVHASKGLEYPHVYLIGVEEGLMPHAGREEDGLDDVGGMPVDREKIDAERLEEERRLMYVAITRARRSLTLSWCRQRKRARQMVDCQPSRFITEMGLEADSRNSAPLGTEEARKRLAALRAMLGRSTSTP
ncbi:MAG: exodeoxyribonuclease V subunit gamma [Lautropia sp.]|nr:exodeoxyribonuclease V subunit gamma [Lautropia sp.]